MISINPIKKSDYYKILQIEQSLFEDPMTQTELNNFVSQNYFKIWKIEKDRIIGYVSFYKVKEEVEIIKIGIMKSYQRKNYGSCLIKELKKLNIQKIFLEVSSENIHTINFYIKNGFKKIGLRKKYYKSINGPNIDAIRLCLKL